MAGRSISRPRQLVRVQRPHVFVEAQQGDAMAGITLPEQRGAGTIRKLWRNSFGITPAPAPFGWAQNPPLYTRALRYKATSLFMRAGNSNTDWGEPRPIIRPRARQPLITRQAGNKPSQPTIRNRLISFGARVPPLNQASPNIE